MYYIYSLSVELSAIAFILLLGRVIVNKSNIKLKSSKYNWKLILSLFIINLIPMLNVVFTISSIYISIFMKKEKFIELMNE